MAMRCLTRSFNLQPTGKKSGIEKGPVFTKETAGYEWGEMLQSRNLFCSKPQDKRAFMFVTHSYSKGHAFSVYPGYSSTPAGLK